MSVQIKKEVESNSSEDVNSDGMDSGLDSKAELCVNFKEENDEDELGEYDSAAEINEQRMDEGDGNVNTSEYESMFNQILVNGVSYLECILCFKRLKQSSIRQHFKTHAGVRPHPCDICGSRFTRKNDVLRHKRIVHRKIRPFSCERCNKIFSSRTGLETHLNNHDKNVTYDCGICGFKFGKKEYYENHIKFLHPPEGGVPSNSQEELDDLNEKTENGEDALDEIPEEDNIAEKTDGSDSKTMRNNDSITSFVQLRTESQSDCNTETLVNKILDAAIQQSKNALQSISPASSQYFLPKEKKPNSVRVCISTSVNGSPKEFLIDVFAEKSFDVESPSGMQMLFNLVSEVCADQGPLDGQIEVQYHKT